MFPARSAGRLATAAENRQGLTAPPAPEIGVCVPQVGTEGVAQGESMAPVVCHASLLLSKLDFISQVPGVIQGWGCKLQTVRPLSELGHAVATSGGPSRLQGHVACTKQEEQSVPTAPPQDTRVHRCAQAGAHRCSCVNRQDACSGHAVWGGRTGAAELVVAVLWREHPSPGAGPAFCGALTSGPYGAAWTLTLAAVSGHLRGESHTLPQRFPVFPEQSISCFSEPSCR